MLSVHLIFSVMERVEGQRGVRPLLDDARFQAAYCLDAPSDVHDGVEWFEDEDPDCCGVVPRIVSVRYDP